MKKRAPARAFFILIVLMTWTSGLAWAQLDPSSSILLRSGSREPEPSDLDTNRYKVRETKTRAPSPDFEEEKSGTLIPTPTTSKTAVNAEPEKPLQAAPSTPGIAPQDTAATTSPKAVTPSATEPPPATTATPPALTTQVKELIMGGTEEDIAEYRKQIHPQDPRANVVELTLAPAFFYNDSSSRYSFHRFNSRGLGFQVGARFWLTPFFGLQGQSFSSLASSVPSGVGNSVLTDYQLVDAGFRFRRHFGWSRKAPSLHFGLDYHQSETKIGQDATDLVGSSSSGMSVVIEGHVPWSATYENTFSIELSPRLHHTELGTGVLIKSGTKSQTIGVGVSAGGQWVLDRQNQIFWKLHHSVNQTLFDGEATTPDPATGVTPRGVSVTDSLTLFTFGLTWGT